MSEGNNNESSNELQKTASDPNLVGPEDTHTMKMTGEGEPGSHSAVFGLTPDGKRHDDTSHGTTISKPAHGEETAVGGGTVPNNEQESSNTSSKAATGGGGVAEQMHDPRVGERADGQGTGTGEASAGDKPGSGLDGPAQGTGKVGDDTSSGGGLMDKVKSYVS